MNKAEKHIIAAIRRLEMMLWYTRQKKVKPHRHVLAYFDLITNDLAQIQAELLSDDEYTESIARGLARVSRTREYHYSVTSDNDGKIYYNVDALLPLSEMKENVVFAKRKYINDQ